MGKIKDWLIEGEKEERFLISDIAEHGCAGGIGGLIYFVETTAFYNEYEGDVWKHVRKAAEAAGESVFYLLDKDIAGPTAFKNSMVWLAVEICAQELVAAAEAA